MLPSFSSENYTNPSTTVNLNTTSAFHTAQIPEQTNEQQPNYRYGFFMVDNEILDQYGAALGPYAFTVYSAICRYADRNGQCFPSVSTLSNVTGMSESSVHRALNTLEQQKLIYRTARFDSKRGQRANVYTLIPIEKTALVEGKEGVPLGHPASVCALELGESVGNRGGVSQTEKQNKSDLNTLEQKTERKTTRKDSSKIDSLSTPVETVVVGVNHDSPPPQALSNLKNPEQEERLSYVRNRFAELTDNDQPNSRELIQLEQISRYAKRIIDNAFDAALEWTTNPHKTEIRDAAAWLLGTTKRMAERGGTSVKPRADEPTSEAYRRFNRENGGVLLGLSGSIEEGGSCEAEIEDKVEAEVKIKTGPQPQPQSQSQPPTEGQTAALARAKEQMKVEINPTTFGMAIEPLVLLAVEGERYTLQTPSPGMLQFLKQNGIGHVKRVFREHLGQPRAIIEFEPADYPTPIDPTRRRYS